jgi:hypothetical protein
VRLTLAICVGLILSSLAYSQAGNDPEYVIRRMVDTGIFEGHDQKVIGRLGDAGAVFLTKILAGRDLTSNTIDNALVVIEGVFAGPNLVEVAGDRQPRTALLVLRYLDLSTTDDALKERIADTRKYVQDHYAASRQETKQ